MCSNSYLRLCVLYTVSAILWDGRVFLIFLAHTVFEVPVILSLSTQSHLTRCFDPQEQENRDLLERFRMAHSEMEEHEQKLQQVEGLNNSIRLELLSSDTERRHLRDTVGQQEREIHQVRRGLKQVADTFKLGRTRSTEIILVTKAIKKRLIFLRAESMR